MLPCLHRVLLRSALSPASGSGLVRTARCIHTTPDRSAAAPPPPPCALVSASSVQSRHLGTHPLKEPMEPLNSPQSAKEFIYSLHPSERNVLLRELHRFESMAIAQGQLEVAPPTRAQLRYVLLHNAIPFVGFGFLDNAIMIVAGTQIELSIGVILGISTMAAAALGNLVSDLAGLGLAGYVEVLACRLGMQIPDLNPKQADMWQTRVSSHAGKGIGVGIGCILGMFPLLFFKDDEKKKKKKEEEAAAREEAAKAGIAETQTLVLAEVGK
ncbi:transmembrane protein 65-like isoform X2 [Gadus macrocephalus]|uniref:transmembrane protein 65 n=1 Tax=Gadus chalcogrammus TaxID=1042646 RepID=UPI0024C4D6BB|nr:transmembrane protein 65 [Gadus chalcogrammus]XP_059921353.1 transmembrane protein 65-like isoform X2 [Gadus macrocephalus]